MMNSKENKTITFETIGELFSGPGGGGLGASMAELDVSGQKVRIKHKWATDLDQDTCDTYERNINKYQSEVMQLPGIAKVLCGDVNDFNLAEDGEFESVDGLLFGFPCNDFSIVGESKGIEGKFGPLYKHGITILNRSDKPKWFLAENVGGITSANEGNAFSTILKEMDAAGYNIVAHKYKFEEYGIPQKRHRVVIVGILKKLGKCFEVPRPSGITKTAGQALANIPDDAKHQQLTKQSEQVIQRLKHTKPGQNAWSADIPDDFKLNVKNTKLSNIYKRLDKDKPAYTVTGSGGGGTHMYHWEENRALTNRERARIQTFPDWFEFCGSKESIRKQIGMAIPPDGAKIIVEGVLATLYNVKYPTIPANIDAKEIIEGDKQLYFDI